MAARNDVAAKTVILTVILTVMDCAGCRGRLTALERAMGTAVMARVRAHVDLVDVVTVR